MATHMNIILSRDVINLGHIGDVVKVRPGYARNYLFPRQFALPASEERVHFFEHQKRVVEHQRRKLRDQSEGLKKQLATVQITISAKSGEQGKLFGSVGTRDIAAGLKAVGFHLDHHDVKLEAPIKTLGLHTVDVRLEADVKAKVNVLVVSDAPVEEKAAAAESTEASTEEAAE